MPHLMVKKCPVAIPPRIELKAGTHTVGRVGVDIAIPDPCISSRHFTLTVTGFRVELTDLGSRNGTYLDGCRISGGLPLKHGQTIRAGDTELEVFLVDPMQLENGNAPLLTTRAATGAAETTFASLLELKISPASIPDPVPAPPDPGTARFLIRHLRRFEQGMRELHAALNAGELLERAMGLLLETLHCDSGFLLTLNPHDPAVVADSVAYQQGRRIGELPAHHRNRALINKVLETRSGILCEIRHLNRATTNGLTPAPQTVVCCPIHSDGHIVGVACLENKFSGAPMDKVDLELLLALASLIGIAIENSRTLQQIGRHGRICDNLGRFLADATIDRVLREKNSGYPHLQPRRTHVAVLHTKIRGFTQLCAGLDPAAVAAMLNVHVSAMADTAQQAGGALHTIANDRVVVLFGAPFELDEPEVAAVHAALDMRRRLRELQPQWEQHGLPHFDISTGITCGECLVGTIGGSRRMEYAAIGDCVGKATQLCRAGQAGQVLLLAPVVAALKQKFHCRPAGAVSFRDGETPVFELAE